MEPQGPLPPEIYWRRRALAIGVIVVVLILLVWLVSSIRGGSADPETAAAESSAVPTMSATATTSADSSGASGASGGSGGGSEPAGESPENSSATATTSTSGSAAPVAPGQCADQSLAIKVSPSKPTYGADEEPEFTTVVTNIGSTACERDLAGGFQQVVVSSLDGAQRLWSSTDCFPQADPDIRKLDPGQQAAFTVKWSGKTSTPECATEQDPQRDAVSAGAYSVVGQLGALRSAPEPFNLA
nr:hypothetical protein [Rhodococcus sp. HNM0569]